MVGETLHPNYKYWKAYNDHRLAAKQADKMYNHLIILRKRLRSENREEVLSDLQQYYSELHNTHLYKKQSALYCQVLSDAVQAVPVNK